VFVSFVSFLTAYYIFREGFVMFYGPERHKGHFEEEPHEAPSVMFVPMVVLAIGSTVVGFFEGWYMGALKETQRDAFEHSHKFSGDSPFGNRFSVFGVCQKILRP
jgi:NADH:ubiquinone oxidoreductase subunit 5 (subunit L)/multisubunit Na+/H+ antiporter MnhA subunit